MTVRVRQVANASSYVVYRKVGSRVTTVGEAADGVIRDTKPVSGKKASYYAVARTRKTGYADSVAGEARTVTLAKDTSKVKGKADGRTIRVSFKKVKGARGYLIYRSEKKNGLYKKLTKKPVKKLAYTDRKVKKGKTYYYKVVVYGKNKTYSAGKCSAKVKVR